jgi:hypothetical protein
MKKADWNLIIGFCAGVAIVIGLMIISRIATHQNLYQYEWYILILSILVLVAALVLRNRSAGS